MKQGGNFFGFYTDHRVNPIWQAVRMRSYESLININPSEQKAWSYFAVTTFAIVEERKQHKLRQEYQ